MFRGSSDSRGLGDVETEAGGGVISIEFRIFAGLGQLFSFISGGTQCT